MNDKNLGRGEASTRPHAHTYRHQLDINLRTASQINIRLMLTSDGRIIGDQLTATSDRDAKLVAELSRNLHRGRG
jgi:hypothetical protein